MNNEYSMMFLRENAHMFPMGETLVEDAVEELLKETADLGTLSENMYFDEKAIPIYHDEDGFFIEYSDLMRVVENYQHFKGAFTEEMAVDTIIKEYSIDKDNLYVVLPNQETIDSYVEACKNESDVEVDAGDDSDDESTVSVSKSKPAKKVCKKNKSRKKISKFTDSIKRMKKAGINLVKRK